MPFLLSVTETGQDQDPPVGSRFSLRLGSAAQALVLRRHVGTKDLRASGVSARGGSGQALPYCGAPPFGEGRGGGCMPKGCPRWLWDRERAKCRSFCLPLAQIGSAARSPLPATPPPGREGLDGEPSTKAANGLYALPGDPGPLGEAEVFGSSLLGPSGRRSDRGRRPRVLPPDTTRALAGRARKLEIGAALRSRPRFGREVFYPSVEEFGDDQEEFHFLEPEEEPPPASRWPGGVIEAELEDWGLEREWPERYPSN